MKKSIAFILSLLMVIFVVGCASMPTETTGESIINETTDTQETTLASTEAYDDPPEYQYITVKDHYKAFVRAELEEAARIDGAENVDVEYGVKRADIDLFGFFSGHAVALTTNIRYDGYTYEDVGKYRFHYRYVNYGYRIRVETQAEDGSYTFISLGDAFKEKLVTESDLDEIYIIYMREYSY